MKKIIVRWRWLCLCAPLLFATTLMADETEIYFADKSGDVPPNVLFMIDSSGSMKSLVAGDAAGRNRLQVLKDTFAQVMKSAPSNLNVGLMHYADEILQSNSPYYWNSIKGVNFPATPIDDPVGPLLAPHQALDNLPNPTSGAKVRDFLTSIVNGWTHNGYTPIVDSLYEAARYYRGDAIAWGLDNPLKSWAAHPLTYGEVVSCAVPVRQESCYRNLGQCTGTITSCTTETVNSGACCNPGSDGSCPDGDYSCPFELDNCQQLVCDQTTVTIDSRKYQSPIKYACQANYLVLMSDGKPEYPYYSGEVDGTNYFPPSVQTPTLYASQVKVATKLPAYMGKTSCEVNKQGYNSGTCGPDLTHWLATVDNNPNLPGDQTVQTYTVGFAMDQEIKGKAYLQSLMTVDDGFFEASTANQLADAFTTILNKVSKSSLSFSSPTYSVDQTTLLSHSDEVYIPVFDRDRKPRWPGNLKKFKRNNNGEIVDANNKAVLNNRGEFLNTARDLWATTAVVNDTGLNGAEVTVGGAANRLPAPNSRTLYTDVGTGLSILDKTKLAPNGFITKTLLGNAFMSDAYAQALVDFARGWSKEKDPVTGQAYPRNFMGDMLNTKPLLVDYGTTKRVFAATNEGFLHSIDTNSGIEQWGFMPRSLLKNIKTFYENVPVLDANKQPQHIYGFDGSLTLWNYDSDHNGKIDNAKDKRILFFNMRRGGNAYYALDITSPDTPKILWKKARGDGGAWNNLGETWSKPSLAKMRIGDATTNVLKDVLVFGAGYDPAKDAETSRLPDMFGKDVIIVDALTGNIEWSLVDKLYGGSLGSSPIKHSIPGDIRVMDMDRNGALDRLYFADTGGNLWRVDMDKDIRDGDSTLYDYTDADLTKLADLGTGDNGSDYRKFFYEPDVALMQYGGKTWLTIALGSGYRTHPLNTNTKDRFYVLLDPNVYNEVPNTFVPLTNSDLTAARNSQGLPNNFSLLDGVTKGWYYDLPNNGEKVLAPAVTFLNKAIFTTFAPVDEKGQGPSADPCAVPPNSARAYVLNLLTGRAVADLDDNTASGLSSKDDSVIAGVNEILSSAQIVFRAPESIALDANNNRTCTVNDCRQTVEIHIGKVNLPVMDETNGALNGNTVQAIAESVDLTDILPRIFWRDQDVGR